MPRYRIYCETEQVYVVGQSDEPPTECYNDPAHVVRLDSVVIVGRDVDLKPVATVTNVKAGKHGSEYAEVNGSSWESVSTTLLNASSKPSTFTAVTGMSGSNGQGYVRMFDVTHQQELAVIEFTNEDKQVHRIDIQNLPDEDAIVEIQMRETGSKKARLYYASWEV